MVSLDPRIKALIDHTIIDEGGLVDDQADPGGVTKYGISLREAQKWGMTLDLDGDGRVTGNDIRLLTPPLAADLYLNRYFHLPHLDRLPARIQAQVFDTGVLSGPPRAAIILQQTLNRIIAAAPDLGFARLSEDGDPGSMTWHAAELAERAMGPFLSNALAEAREHFLRSLEVNHPADHKYIVSKSGGLGGWITRCRSYRENV